MKKLKNRLLNLAIGELAAVVVFIYVYQLFDLGKASLLAFTYLIFILLQGSMYWMYRYILLTKQQQVHFKMVQFLKFFRILNLILLIIIAGSMPFIKNDTKDILAAMGIFLFGFIEYINYYWYRLSYGTSGFNLKTLLNTSLKKSSINKLITQYTK